MRLMLPSQVAESAPQTMKGPEVRHVRRGAPSQHRFESARPFEADTAYPPCHLCVANGICGGWHLLGVFAHELVSASMGWFPDRWKGAFSHPFSRARFRLNGADSTSQGPQAWHRCTARMEAAGARAAWSHTFRPPQMTTLLGRRWDAGASQKAGVPGRTETVAETVTVSVTESVPGHAGNTPHRDVPGTRLCRFDLPAPRHIPHNCATGHSTGRAIRCISSGSDGGRRRTSSVVTTFPASSNDHAARATLGRRRRPRRPGVRVSRDRDRCFFRDRDRTRPWSRSLPPQLYLDFSNSYIYTLFIP